VKDDEIGRRPERDTVARNVVAIKLYGADS